MKALEFLIWLRDEVKCCPFSKRAGFNGLPSNGELRQWVKDSVVNINGNIIKSDSIVEFPITKLVFFPKNDKARVTIF